MITVMIEGVPGLYYIEDYVNGAELLADVLAIVNLEPISAGSKSRRVAHYGRSYSYTTGKLGDAPDIPDLLVDLPLDHDTTADITFNQLIVNEYKNGQKIAPHIDAACFGPVIACISLGAPTKVIFERGLDRKVINVVDGSMYIMTGGARYLWKHSISHVGKPRHSLTYRTIL